MLILSHRGYWLMAAEKNTPTAFARSFHRGYGTETDVRDLAGSLVVSHDSPTTDALPIDVLLGIYQGIGADVPLAINVKADGLQKLLPPMLERFAVTNWFVFDMSVPDALGWLKVGAPTFTRHSDLEPDPAFYSQAVGVWLDAFHTDWWTIDTIRRHRDAGKKVCIVSPELHQREHRSVWDQLALADFRDDSGVMLCTDYPDHAREVLGG